MEISGKRPGTEKQRPTEKFDIKYDHVIISNNSEGYESKWDIINVPDDYRQYYIANHKNSDNAWYAPMNRSYAIKYAREKGYDYLVQMDDNIILLEFASLYKAKGIQRRIRICNKPGMVNAFIDMMVTVLENTNAVMAGCDMAGTGEPNNQFLSERFCYSFFCLKLSDCPDVFQGDFEDDIEYRLKCAQMGLPCVQIVPMRYGKTGQQKTKDLSGCREEYLKAGIKRGSHMSVLYGDVYRCIMRQKGNSINSGYDKDNVNFKHFMKTIKVGVVVYDMDAIRHKMAALMNEYNTYKPDKVITKTRKVRKKCKAQ